MNCKVSDGADLPPYMHSTASSEIHMNVIRSRNFTSSHQLQP